MSIIIPWNSSGLYQLVTKYLLLILLYKSLFLSRVCIITLSDSFCTILVVMLVQLSVLLLL